MRPKHFYERTKVRLGDLRSVRAEMAFCYRACVRREMTWDDFRSATLGLSRIARIDEGAVLEQRIAELEARLGISIGKPNGHAEARL